MAIEILQNTLLKLIVRQGTDATRKNVILDSGEIGYSTDTKRLFVGDGITYGGVLIGNVFQGKAADVTSFSPCEIGDMAYNTNKNILQYVKQNDGSSLSDWDDLSVGILTSGDDYIDISANYEISLNALSAGMLSNDVVASNSPIYLDGNGRLELRYQSPIIKNGNQLTIDTQVLNPDFINLIYPVGSVYLSYNSVNPSVLFTGTTWVQVGQGMYLAGVGTGNDINSISKSITAGNNPGIYQINIPAVPPHKHGVGQFTAPSNNDFFMIKGDWSDGNSYIMRYTAGDGFGTGDYLKTGSPYGITTSLPIEETGNSNTLSAVAPPAYGLYMWRRTA